MNATVLFVPGLRDHVAEHWQTLMARQIPGSRTVEPLTENKLSCDARVEALNMAIEAIDGPIVLVAHSAGCLMVAHWAERYERPIRGALMATPADIETPLPAGYPTLKELSFNDWLPIPRRALPFRTIVAASANDPLANLSRLYDLAQGWEAELEVLGEVGHLNPASGFGPWPSGLKIVRDLEHTADNASRRRVSV